jgi:hypothetical protein
MESNSFLKKFNDFRNKDKMNELKKYLFEKNYDKKFVYEITLSNRDKKIYTLTPKSFNDFLILNNKRYFEKEDHNHFKTSSSNCEFKYKKIKSIKIKQLSNPIKELKNKDNAFFKHLNKTDIDLKRYQIITKNDDTEIIKKHCLIHSLELSEIEKSKLNSLKLHFLSGTHISLSQMDKVCDFIRKKIIIHSYRNENTKKQTKTYGKKFNDFVELASFDNHLFVYEKTSYNKYFIDNYEKLKDEKNRENIYKMNKIRKWYSKENDNSKKCDSLYLIKKLYDKKLFKNNSLKLRDTFMWEQLGSQVKDYDIPLDNLENECRLKKIKQKKEKKINVFYADTENFVKDKFHKLMMIGVVKNNSNDVEIFKVKNQINDFNIRKCVFEFLNYIKDNTDENHTPIIYFHNLKYDYSVLEKYLTTRSCCKKDGILYSASISYKSFKYELRDTFKFLNVGLKKFTKIFDLKHLKKQEAIAYRFYDYDNYNKNIHCVNEYKKYLKKEEKQIFDEILIKSKKDNLFDYDEKNQTFNAVKYYEYYLKFDCLVLKEGFTKFSLIIKDITKLNLFNYLTISSLTYRYFEINGAFNEIYEMKGNLREFCSKSIRGGRTDVCKEFIKKYIKENLCDFDGVSLYPSSIYRTCEEIGLPKGKAKELTIYDKLFLDKVDYYIIKIKLKKINKKQQNPFISVKNNKGILEYINEID